MTFVPQPDGSYERHPHPADGPCNNRCRTGLLECQTRANDDRPSETIADAIAMHYFWDRQPGFADRDNMGAPISLRPDHDSRDCMVCAAKADEFFTPQWGLSQRLALSAYEVDWDPTLRL